MREFNVDLFIRFLNYSEIVRVFLEIQRMIGLSLYSIVEKLQENNKKDGDLRDNFQEYIFKK